MSRAAALKRWPGWALLAVVALALLAVTVTREAEPLTPEERIEEISQQVSCPVCDGESVYESRNSASAAIRAEIKALVAGGQATDDDIVASIVERFPETQIVPKSSGFESLVWVLPMAALACAVLGLFVAFRRWRMNTDTIPDDDDRALVEAALAAGVEVEEPAPEAADPAEPTELREPRGEVEA